jgi:hypothetical protein
MQDSLVAVFVAFLIIIAIAFYLHKRKINEYGSRFEMQLSKTNLTERQAHVNEIKYLAERNNSEIAHATANAKARENGFDEGRKRGIAETELEVKVALAKQSGEFVIQLQLEKNRAAAEARELQRAEHELQAKLFSVKISPYVQLVTNKGLVYDDFESRVGYQYQLLINGIPAFQPHIVIERHEKVKEFDETVKATLCNVAQTCAEAALSTYMGANPQFAKIAPIVLDKLAK